MTPGQSDWPPGRIVYLMGASGAGKDSVMRLARQRIDSTRSVVFAHRYITRANVEGAEHHVPLSTQEFKQRVARGLFLWHWDSHGYRYGIGMETDVWRRCGLDVVVNGSRAYLPEACHRVPDLLPVLLQASPERLRDRLAARGRETEAAISARLQRAVTVHPPQAESMVTIDNNGDLEQAVEAFLRLLA